MVQRYPTDEFPGHTLTICDVKIREFHMAVPHLDHNH